MAKKSYSFSLSEESFKKFAIICEEGHFNRSRYLQSMIDVFITSILAGNFDGGDSVNKFSETINQRFQKEILS